MKRCGSCKEMKPRSAFGNRKRSPDGLQTFCKPCLKAYKAEWKKSHPEKQKEYRKTYESTPRGREKTATKRREWFARLAEEFYAHYGRVCVCCGEDRPEFLTIDHVGGRTQEEKDRGGGPNASMIQARREGFPDRFRILCWNCNCSRGIRGYCPHECEREQENVA